MIVFYNFLFDFCYLCENTLLSLKTSFLGMRANDLVEAITWVVLKDLCFSVLVLAVLEKVVVFSRDDYLKFLNGLMLVKLGRFMPGHAVSL